jgi:hypothetical protein
LNELANIQCDGIIPFCEVIAASSKYMVTGSGVILISSCLDEWTVFEIEKICRRGLNPFFVFIDGSTFGSMTTGDQVPVQLSEKLSALNVPLCTVRYGDNLSSTLSMPAVFFQGRYDERIKFR